MKRMSMLKKQIRNLITGEPNGKTIIAVWLINSETGERTLYGKFPDNRNLNVLADSPETAETFLKLRNPITI